jgi:hypothetical protein
MVRTSKTNKMHFSMMFLGVGMSFTNSRKTNGPAMGELKDINIISTEIG